MQVAKKDVEDFENTGDGRSNRFSEAPAQGDESVMQVVKEKEEAQEIVDESEQVQVIDKE